MPIEAIIRLLEQFRRGGQIDRSVSGFDMPQKRGQERKPGLHIDSLPIPPQQTLNGAAVTKVMQSGPA